MRFWRNMKLTNVLTRGSTLKFSTFNLFSSIQNPFQISAWLHWKLILDQAALELFSLPLFKFHSHILHKSHWDLHVTQKKGTICETFPHSKCLLFYCFFVCRVLWINSARGLMEDSKIFLLNSLINHSHLILNEWWWESLKTSTHIRMN